MKEAIICFVIAMVIGSMLNTSQIDVWGTIKGITAPAAVVQLVTEGEFEDEVLNSKQPVLVDFYNDTDSKSKAMIPVVAEAAKELKDSIRVVRVDVVDCPTIAKMYDVTSVPDFVVFKNKEKVDHILGKMDKYSLVSFAKLKATRGTHDEAPTPELDSVQDKRPLGTQPQVDQPRLQQPSSNKSI